MATNNIFEQSTQDVSKSIDQLVGQLTFGNISVPRLDRYKDVFEFINEFETVTATLSNEQQLRILIKAFPPGRLRAWYDREIKSHVANNSPWATVKAKIISYYSDKEDQDRYFSRLHSMKFDPEGHEKLFVFVEDLLYVFGKAFNQVDSNDVKIRYVKSVLPPSVSQSLSQNSNFANPTDMTQFLKAIRQYDTSRAHETIGQSDNKHVNTAELVKIIKDLVKQESEKSTKIIAAMLPNARGASPNRNFDSRAESPRRTRFDEPRQRDLESSFTNQGQNRPSGYDRRSPSPGRRNVNGNQSYNWPNYHHPTGRYNRIDDPRGSYQGNRYGRPSSPYVNDRARSQSPGGANIPAQSGQQARNNQGYNHLANDHYSNPTQQPSAFSDETYYGMFGVPPRACGNCGAMHWDRHCLLNLK